MALGAEDLLTLQRAAFARDGYPGLAVRKDRLSRFGSMLYRNVGRLADAATEDFGYRSREFGTLFAMAPIIDMAYHHVKLRRWMKVRRPSILLSACGIDQTTRSEPKGVVGVMGPWNFPSELTLGPAASALAAGNRVMLWQSPEAPATAEVVTEIVRQYFAPEELAVFSEPHGSGEAFSQLNFDHLFFTGSRRVGALVASAAGKNLVPVTLELGGKNPAVIATQGNITRASKVLFNLRLLNGGQACVCPDYVFVPEGNVEEFIHGFLAESERQYPLRAEQPGYTSIIDDKNYRRVLSLIEGAERGGAKRWESGTADRAVMAAERKIAPTILTGVTPDMQVSQDEVFAPVLCVYPYKHIDEVISYVGQHDSPLTMYWFGPKQGEYRALLNSSRSGSLSIGDGLLGLASPFVPFGGIGSSGMGAYHGKYGFDTFSYVRPVVRSRLPFSVASVATPPYPRIMSRILERIFGDGRSQ
ncbi:aldehyde dehydrogenase [Mycobacteroides stephanolepidis]|uniref:Aldehyde dehydrogenase n=1 Tax=[Mycobacterium] stephanolepidis TaxID=1520670 RepID=A0A1Z4F0N9_9MYCO|nr:aldehyde dehydrogenase family protein [[Mycobacterium] stephanolepidis]BAX98776.1 aldehyde dehydrogenase [[Mycobacterium] stephanolepidis]